MEIFSKKKKKDRINDDIVNLVRDFYLLPEITKQVPDKTEVVGLKSETEESNILLKHVMVMTLEDAHSTLKEKHSSINIGLTSFKKFKSVPLRVHSSSEKWCFEKMHLMC